MNLQQALPHRSSTNGFGRRRGEKEISSMMDSKPIAKPVSSNFGSAGLSSGGKGVESAAHDRLIYILTCLIGHSVEVHVKNGSIISGIFHAANAATDFGIVLKMARVIKNASVKGQMTSTDVVKKPQTMIISSSELVQVIAKDLSLSGHDFTNVNSQDLMIDSAISGPHQFDGGRDLKPWTPDVDDPECTELENIFDRSWKRNWDQFETNANLFGVKSTFNEELYTTKLERGPQMREREREAIRIAREIQEEDTKDLHLAEERGIQLHGDFDLDEEIRFSAVRRDVDDGRFEEMDESILEAYNTKTFGGSISSPSVSSNPVIPIKRVNDEPQATSTCSSMDEDMYCHVLGGTDACNSGSSDHVLQLEKVSRLPEVIEDLDAKKGSTIDYADNDSVEFGTSKSIDIHPLTGIKSLSPNAAAFSPLGEQNKQTTSGSLEPTTSCELPVANEPVNPLRPSSSTSSSSENVGIGTVSSVPKLSPCSSLGSLSSEKSTLNPHAKEFKLNPNARSFTPTASIRPNASASEGSFYYAGGVSPVPHMHGVPVGIGVGPPPFGVPQQVVYNPHATQLQPAQAYVHPNGPLYGQQMIVGQPRPVVYLPTYPHEMPYKGRNF